MIAALGWLLFAVALVLLYRRRRAYQRGLLAGQRQAELAHGWHRPVDADEASLSVPGPRRRSPDRKFERQPARLDRPVFYDR